MSEKLEARGRALFLPQIYPTISGKDTAMGRDGVGVFTDTGFVGLNAGALYVPVST